MISNFAGELLWGLSHEQTTMGEMLVRHRLTQDILYLAIVQSENMKAIPSEL